MFLPVRATLIINSHIKNWNTLHNFVNINLSCDLSCIAKSARGFICDT